MPFDIRCRLWLSTGPVDVSGDLVLRDGVAVQIERGSSRDSGQPIPARCVLNLDNRAGDYSPRNPAGTHFGRIGRNTPITVSVRPDTTAMPRVRDTFTRTAASSWGTPDDGPAWVLLGGAASDFAVSGGRGRVTLTSVAAPRHAYSGPAIAADVEAVWTVRAPLATGTGNLETELQILTGPDDLAGIQCRIEFTPSATIKVSFRYDDAASSETAIANVTTGITHTGAAQSIRTRFVASGPYLAARVWDAAGAEPTTWTLLDALSTAARVRRGWVALRCARATGNTNADALIEWDGVEIDCETPRFVGEVAAWMPKSDGTDADIWTRIEASGALRRLGAEASADVIHSPMRRTLGDPVKQAADRVVAYWPMEDGSSADDGQGSAFGSPMRGVPPLRIVGGTTQGRNDGWAGSTPLPVLYTAVARSGFRPGPYGSLDSSLWLSLRLDPTRETVSAIASHVTLALMRLSLGNGGNVVEWRLEMEIATGSLRVTGWDKFGVQQFATGFVNFAIGPMTGGSRGKHHQVLMALDDTGSSVDVVLAVAPDREVGLATSVNCATARGGPPIFVQIGDGSEIHASIGHVIAANKKLDLFTASDAFAGHRFFESARDRLPRLCAEYDVPYVGTSSTSGQPLGAQPVGSLLDVLADTAQGVGWLVESLPLGRLSWLLGSDLAAAAAGTPRLTLTCGVDVSLPLALDDDDQGIVNDATVSRRGGAAARVEATEGPNGITAAGRYSASRELPLSIDEQAEQFAAWFTHVGTWDEPPPAPVTVDLGAIPSLVDPVAKLDIGSLVRLTSLPRHLAVDDVDFLVAGWTEEIDVVEWTLRIVGVPAGPYSTFTEGDSQRGRADTMGSTLGTAITTSTATLSVSTTVGPLWTTDPADYPLDLELGGVERVTATSGSGTTSPQSIVVTRNVGGFNKAHSAGASIRLWQPGRALL